MKLRGALARRDNEPVGAYCPIERTLGVLSTRSAMLVMREAFYGATRFEEFAARADLTDATTSARCGSSCTRASSTGSPTRSPGNAAATSTS